MHTYVCISVCTCKHMQKLYQIKSIQRILKLLQKKIQVQLMRILIQAGILKVNFLKKLLMIFLILKKVKFLRLFKVVLGGISFMFQKLKKEKKSSLKKLKISLETKFYLKKAKMRFMTFKTNLKIFWHQEVLLMKFRKFLR